VTILARRNDLIVSGGENVYPAEVETALRRLPVVADAAVVGAPDPRWGHVPVAFLVPRDPQATPALDALRAGLDGWIARYKHPKRVVWVDALPRLGGGKVDRLALRERAAEALV
jgi:acyl-CoA synthetase (AMP-forming)/AMP-acid ligase II